MTDNAHVPPWAAERKQAREDHERHQPVAFAQLDRDEQAMELIFEGLRRHYVDCITERRLEIWARAAHAAVDLLAAPNTKVHTRASVVYGNALAKLEILLRDVQINPRIVEACKNGANV